MAVFDSTCRKDVTRFRAWERTVALRKALDAGIDNRATRRARRRARRSR